MRNRINRLFAFSLRKVLFVFIFVLAASALIAIAFNPSNVRASAEAANESSLTGSSRPSSQSNSRSPDNIWEFVLEDSIAPTGERQIIPQAYRTARVNEDALSELLGKAPLEFTREAAVNRLALSLPMPDGSFAMFRVEESPIMEPLLAAQYPEIKTYQGKGIDDPTSTARLDLTPSGFHAMVLSARGTIYVDPYAKNDTANYISYFKGDYRNDAEPFRCDFSEDGKASNDVSEAASPDVINGTILRTYRLALAATGEYSAFAGGTVPTALASMTTTMNRVNGIYERELAVRMVLVANASSIIYTNAGTDPYTNNNGSMMLGQNQTNLDAVIGSANYDIGHVFSTGGGGVAGLSVVCSNANKARGVTGLPSPVGDGFAVDFVAHEIGHQFGGLHTFNGTTSNCGGGNRSGSAAYEPGSGSTIMAYAGICGAQNLQAHSDDYFHVKSLEQIATFIAANPCDVETNTGNTSPAVTVGAAVTIPRGTPFVLTASGNDPNGDALTYCWEEYDLGPSSPPDTDADGSTRPIFRSFPPTTSSSRTFPKLSDVLNNTSTFGEALPSINRTMSFQVTVRDNRIGGGGINTATAQVVVSASAGPFVVTQPNTSVTWTGGTQQSIAWSVANTTAAPVNAANVKISLSMDGGNTFPAVLAASTPNDGAETLTIPNTPTSLARVKVEAVGNIFFDLSNTNFTIIAGSASTSTIGVYDTGTQTFFLRNSNTSGFADLAIQYGPPTATPLVGDWDGDGVTTIGVYDSTTQTFYLRNSNSLGFANVTFRYGPPGAIPLAGDWNGDGVTTIGIYDAATETFYLRNSNSAGFADITTRYGPPGAVPVVGDWDGNGTTTPGVYDPTSRTFYLRNSLSPGFADLTIAYGPSGATPVVGDWDGNGTATIGVYDPSNQTFYLRNTNTIGFADLTIRYGPPGATPLAGDWDGL